jgi:hypothetical protein
MTKRCESSPPAHAGNAIDGTTRATARRAAQDAPLWGARRKPHPKGADTLRNSSQCKVGSSFALLFVITASIKCFTFRHQRN